MYKVVGKAKCESETQYPEASNLRGSQLHQDLTHSLDEHILHLIHSIACSVPVIGEGEITGSTVIASIYIGT